MAEADGAASVIRMRGAGYYSEHTDGARLAIEAAIPLALEAVRAIDLTAATGAFAIADYGAADGGTSIALHHAVLGALRARTGRALTLTYTDLPHNDFSALFRLLHGVPPGRVDAALAGLPGVFTFASGTSFHRQIMPDATLSFGFSATAMHWLSRLPVTLVDQVHAVGAQGGELAAFRRQAAADWEAILLHRARELVPGGRLVLANFCVDEDGRYLGWTGGQNMHARFAAHWRRLAEVGTINAAELRRATFPQHYRTVAEFRAPFEDAASPVSRAGLRLERYFTQITPCPYAQRLRAGQSGEAFARAYVPTLRSWSESTFLGALDPGRPDAERQAIVDRFYAGYAADVAAAPEGHGMDYVHCFMVIAKQAGDTAN